MIAINISSYGIIPKVTVFKLLIKQTQSTWASAFALQLTMCTLNDYEASGIPKSTDVTDKAERPLNTSIQHHRQVNDHFHGSVDSELWVPFPPS